MVKGGMSLNRTPSRVVLRNYKNCFERYASRFAWERASSYGGKVTQLLGSWRRLFYYGLSCSGFHGYSWSLGPAEYLSGYCWARGWSLLTSSTFESMKTCRPRRRCNWLSRGVIINLLSKRRVERSSESRLSSYRRWKRTCSDSRCVSRYLYRKQLTSRYCTPAHLTIVLYSFLCENPFQGGAYVGRSVACFNSRSLRPREHLRTDSYLPTKVGEATRRWYDSDRAGFPEIVSVKAAPARANSCSIFALPCFLSQLCKGRMINMQQEKGRKRYK